MKCVNKHFSRWIVFSLMVLVFDQLTKYLAHTQLLPYRPIEIMPFFNLTLAFNTGAAFSFLSGSGDWHQWFFTGFAMIMTVVLTVWLMRTPTRHGMQALAISLILGGAVGNLLDRLAHGYVIDFLDVHYQHYHWPIFNLADSAISLGALFLIIDMLRTSSAE